VRILRSLVALVFLIVCFGLMSLIGETVSVPAGDPAISYVGRWGIVKKTDRTTMVTVNSSSQVYVTFTGLHIAGLFDLDGIDCLEQIVVRVDGGPWRLFTVDKPRIEFFPAGLSQGSHRLEMAVKALDSKTARWLMPLRSAVAFRGFELDAGARASRVFITQKRPRLEFLGDSITQGDGVVGTNPTAVMNGNALSSFAWLAGEALGTTHAQIAFPGQGVMTSDSREVPPAIFSFGWNFAGSAVDFSGGPDFLVINLGLNDDGISVKEFVQAYVELLRVIRQHCPQTTIFAIRPFRGDRHQGNDVEMAVKTFADPLVHFVDSSDWLAESDFTDRAHLNLNGSKKAAARLEQVLSPYIANWKGSK